MRSPTDAQDLFGEALEIKKDHAGALMGLALVASENFEARAGDLAKKALEIDPKLVEAQELLARIALEDNNNAEGHRGSQEGPGDGPEFAAGARRFWPPSTGWRIRRKRPGIPTPRKAYETVGHFFVMNRRYEEGIQYFRKAIELDPQLYSARSKLGINLMRLGQNDEAYKQLELCFNNEFQDAATRNSLKLMDSYKNFVTVHHADHHPEAAQEGSRPAAPLFPERDGARHGDLREEVQAQARKARCRWRSIPTTRISRSARWACRGWARWA